MIETAQTPRTRLTYSIRKGGMGWGESWFYLIDSTGKVEAAAHELDKEALAFMDELKADLESRD